MNAAIYVRTACVKGSRHVLALQKRQCLQYAANCRMRVKRSGIFVERPGLSPGKPKVARNKLLAAVRKGEFNIVLVGDLSRLSRNLPEILMLLAECRSNETE